MAATVIIGHARAANIRIDISDAIQAEAAHATPPGMGGFGKEIWRLQRKRGINRRAAEVPF